MIGTAFGFNLQKPKTRKKLKGGEDIVGKRNRKDILHASHLHQTEVGFELLMLVCM